MESYGELLKTTRESKQIDLDRASREISIEKRYLEGLEAEDNGVFPGDAYMVGFLKNYADYLELDSEFILKLYRNKQIQESPLPQGLYEPHKPRFFLPAIIIPSALLVAVVIVVLSLLIVKKKNKTEDGVVVSSGMKSRLAFSIACMVQPDIIILDEVLGVGDGAFQLKSANRMKSILANGVTGIFVSHAVGQVQALCNKILWLDHGNQVGFTEDVKLYCDAYREFLQTKKLPGSPEDIQELARRWKERNAVNQKKKDAAETQRLKNLLIKGTSETALQAAIAIIEKQNPELLQLK